MPSLARFADLHVLTDEEHCDLAQRCVEVGRMLGSMIKAPSPFLIKTQKSDV